MMEILFRGKRTINGDWVYGDFVHGNERKSLRDSIFVYDSETQSFNDYEINPSTLGQYTGLTDKNGKRIFEGDIIRKTNKGRYPEIFTANIYTKFPAKEEVHYGPCERFTESCEYEIIGNIHDNPELLKGKLK